LCFRSLTRESGPGQSGARAFTSGLAGLYLGSIFVAALGLRILRIQHESLWTDEVFAATFAVQPLFDLIVANLRFDAHPPVYHLQLHLWAVVSQSTNWLYINSVAWSWAAVLGLWRCSRDLLAPSEVMVATLLFALMPVGVEWAHNLRMYGMLGFGSILTWYFCYRFFFSGDDFRRRGLIVAILMLMITYSHVAGLLILGYTGIYSLFIIFQRRPDQVRIWWWGKMYFVTGLLSLPAAVNLLVRDTGFDAPMPTPGVVVESLAYLITGPATGGWLYPIALIAGIFILIGFRADRKIRALLIGFVATPVVFAILVSFLIQPAWTTRMLFVAPPILAMAAARGIFETGRVVGGLVGPLARQITVSCATVLMASGLCAASLWAAENPRKPTNYNAAAQEIRTNLKQGDVILVPEAEAFWGLAWYLVGPNWGSPLAVQDPSPESVSEKWTRILDWLGPVWCGRLNLEPRTRIVSHNGTDLIVGLSGSPLVQNAKRVWLVNYSNNRHPYVQVAGFEESRRTAFGSLTVQLFTLNASVD
jgi:hypothetical protein